jgi:hypothetical protein
MDEVPQGPDDLDPLDLAGSELDDLYDARTLDAIDGWEPPSTADEQLLPSRLVSWSRSSMLGLVMTGWGVGIQEVLQPRADRSIVIEVDDAGEPHDLPIELFLDPDDPSGSLCIVHREPHPPVV